MLHKLFCVIACNSQFERIHAVEPGMTLIGRDDDSSISLPDLHVSREHAVICWSGDQPSIFDLGSRNGTFVNGRRIRRETLLEDGAEFQVGPYCIHVYSQFADAVQKSQELMPNLGDDESDLESDPQRISNSHCAIH